MAVGLPSNRIIERGQSCANCRNWSAEAGLAYWTGNEKGSALSNLARAKQITLGEAGDRRSSADRNAEAAHIMKFVKDMNIGMAQVPPTYGGCLSRLARDKDGKELGRLVSNGYRCEQWSGVPGASLARIGGKLDKDVGEILEDLDGPAAKL